MLRKTLESSITLERERERERERETYVLKIQAMKIAMFVMPKIIDMKLVV